MPTLDYKALAAQSELAALESSISDLTGAMAAKEKSWIRFEPCGPGKAIRRLRPGLDLDACQSEYGAMQGQLTILQERRVELLRELGATEEIFYGR